MAENTSESPLANALQEAQMQTLLDKHRAQIDSILALNANDPKAEKDQQRELARYGIDSEALREFYKDFSVKDAALRRRNDSAQRKTVLTIVAGFFLSLGASLGLRKYFGGLDRLGREDKVQQGMFVAFTTMAATVASAFGASRFFKGRIRAESDQLVRDVHSAFERELAIAIENKERMGEIPPPAPGSESAVASDRDSHAFASGHARREPPAARGSFSAEAAKEKSAPEAAHRA